MSNITCPLCGSAVTVRQSFGRITKPFCARCGWNLERAESSLKKAPVSQILVSLASLAIGLFCLSSIVAGGKHLVPALSILAIFVLAGSMPLWSYLSTTRAIALAKATPSLQGLQVQPIPDAFLRRIQSLSRPRRVRLRFTGAFAVVVLIGVGVLFGFVFYGLARSNAASSSLKDLKLLVFLVFFPLFLGVLMVSLLLKEKRNRPLFQDGEVAAARVLVQRAASRGRSSHYSQIDYEFRASDGQTIRNSEEDLSRKVFEDMLIPVFYDAVNPSRCAALCASYSKFPDA